MKHKTLGLLVGGLALVRRRQQVTATAAKVSVEVEGQTVVQAPTRSTTPASVSKPGGARLHGDTASARSTSAVGGDWDGSYVRRLTRVESAGEPRRSARGSRPGRSTSTAVRPTPAAAARRSATATSVLFYAGATPFDVASRLATSRSLLDAPTTAEPGPGVHGHREATTDTTFDASLRGRPRRCRRRRAPRSAAAPRRSTTGADGTAQVTVAGGPYTLVVTKGNRAPARVAGCATPAATASAGPPTAGTPRDLAAGAAVHDQRPRRLLRDQGQGRRQRRGHRGSPRARSTPRARARGSSAGKVEADGSGIADVRLRLTRNDGGKCSTYDGKTEKFKTIKKCGATHGVWFSVGDNADWSYLLPSKLGRGRYVLDVDGGGQGRQQDRPAGPRHVARGVHRCIAGPAPGPSSRRRRRGARGGAGRLRPGRGARGERTPS